MKSRLSASISLLNLGEQGRSFCFTNAFSSSLKFVLFNGRRRAFSRCQYQGFQSLRTASYSSDDDFADLGPPSEGLATQLKLLTQKPELKVRNGPKTKGLSWSSSHGSPHNIYSIFRTKQPSQTSNSTVKDCDNLSGRNGDLKNSSNVDSSCSVTVEDVTNEVASCDSNFQLVTIRIRGIAKETTDHIIHSICKSIGALEGLAKVDNAVDVLFRVKNDADSQYIVKRLNDTVIDDTQWSAFDLPKITISSSSVEDTRSKIGLQINSRINDMKHQFEYKKLCFEDLLTLHMAVMHLADLPTTLDPQNKH